MSDTMQQTTTSGDVPSLDQMTDRMRADVRELERVQEEHAEIEKWFATAAHRSRYMSDEAHEIGVRDCTPRLNESRAKLERVAERARQNAVQYRKLTDAAPIALDPREQESAARQEPIIRRTVDSGTYADIATALRSALMSNDRGALAVFLSHTPARLKQKIETPAGQWPDEREEEARFALQRMLDQARGQLRDTRYDAVRKLTDTVFAKAEPVQTAQLRRRYAERNDAGRMADGRPKVAWPTEKAS